MAVTGVFKGSLIGLVIDGKKVACETNSEFNYNVQMIPAASTTSGRHSEFVPGKIDWSMTVDANMLLTTSGASVSTVLNAVLSGANMALEWTTNPDVTPFFKIIGNALPQTGGILAPSDNLATWNVTFIGNGLFSVSEEDFWLIINALPFDADKDTYVEQTIEGF